MNICALSVLSAERGFFTSPAIVICQPWLPDMGFIPGALVQVLPEAGGIFLILCNENIHRYSELLQATEEKKGALITVDYCRNGARVEVDRYCIRNAGLDAGGRLIAQYEYGFIRVRKLPEPEPLGLVEAEF